MENIYSLIECYMANTTLNFVDNFVKVSQIVAWLHENKNAQNEIETSLYFSKCDELGVEKY